MVEGSFIPILASWVVKPIATSWYTVQRWSGMPLLPTAYLPLALEET